METKAATCTETGMQRKDCSRCDHFEEDVVPVKGHSYDKAVTDPTCTEDGFTTHTCINCGNLYTDTPVDKLGHDMGDFYTTVEPTCAETGMLRSDCGRCDHYEEEVLPANGHSFARQDEKILCSVCGDELMLHIARDYVALDLQMTRTAQLAVEVTPAHLVSAVQWKLEGEEGIVTLETDGTITALSEGAVHAVATLTYGEFEVSSRCRIDVKETARIEGVQVSTAALTTELYSTAYTAFEILLQLPQNDPAAEEANLISQTAAMSQSGSGMMMESARFTDETMAGLFELQVLDDRNVLLIPTEYAVNTPKAVASKYTGTITVTVQGQEYETEKLTLTVKKTMPKLKATIAAFNSFYSGQSQEIVITGGTVSSIYADESKNTAKTTAIPAWLTLKDGALTLTADTPLKSASGTAYVMVETEEWSIPTAIKLSVKNTYKAPSLKLSATSVTASAKDSAGISLKLLSSDKKLTLEDLNVVNITAPEGYSVENFNLTDGSFLLKSLNGFTAGKVILEISFSDTEVTLPLTLTVKTANVALKLAKTSLTLNKKASDHAEIALTATPADFKLVSPEIRITTSKGVDKTSSGELDVRFENGKIHVATTAKTPDKDTYKVYIKAGGSKEVTLTVNVISAVPTVTYKATGSMDLTFPEQVATITPTFKNYSGGIASHSFSVEDTKTKTDVTEAFGIERSGSTLTIRCINGEMINIANSYKVTLKLTLTDGTEVSNSISLKVKRTSVSLKLTSSKLSLNKLIGESGDVNLTCSTKGYTLVDPIIQVMDSTGKNSAEGKLEVTYQNGKILVNQTEETEYGKTYKVLIKATSYSPAVTLQVVIPAANKSVVTATVKASGKIDVIRDSTSITVTPTYKNCTAQAERTESLIILNAKNVDVTDLFLIGRNDNGSFNIRRNPEAKLDHSQKYKVKLIAAFNGTTVETKEVSLSVSMGSTKLAVAAKDATLFAKDKNDRVVFTFNTTDATQNSVSKVTVKEDTMFDVLDYGNGTYALAYKDGKVHKNLLATGKTTSKAVTVTLNVTLDGNETTKTNAALKLKVTVVK